MRRSSFTADRPIEGFVHRSPSGGVPPPNNPRKENSDSQSDRVGPIAHPYDLIGRSSTRPIVYRNWAAIATLVANTTPTADPSRGVQLRYAGSPERPARRHNLLAGR